MKPIKTYFKKKYIFSFLIYGAAILFFALLLISWLRAGMYSVKDANNKNAITFTVFRGESVSQVAINLEKQGIIKNAIFFKVYVSTKGISKKLKAGDYALSPSMKVSEIAQKIAVGEIEKKKVTIFAGWDLRDIAWYFEEQKICKAEQFFKISGFPAQDFSKISASQFVKNLSKKYTILDDKPENAGLEGYIFPDTYEISSFDTVETLLDKALINLDKKFDETLREEAKKQKKSIYSILTMASILEKEANNLKDKKIVSGILWKRIDKGMPLQVDASVGYITVNDTINISRKELTVDSLYNTYKYEGLPLGPISNPGLDSIKAALEPTKNDYWYYLSTKSHTMVYSKTFEEHLVAKAKYIR